MGFSSLIPLVFLVDCLLRGDLSLVLNYTLADVYLLGLLAVVIRYGVTEPVFGALASMLYLGLGLSLFFPGAHGASVLAVFIAVPFFYALGGLRHGRWASLGFLALVFVLVVLRRTGWIQSWNLVAQPDSLVAAVVCLVVQLVISESHERGHQARIEALVNHRYFEPRTGLANQNALGELTLEPGWQLVLVKVTNPSFLQSWEGILPGTLLGSIPRGAHLKALGDRPLGPFFLSEDEYAFLEPPGSPATLTEQRWTELVRSVTLPGGEPVSLGAEVACYEVGEIGATADRALDEARYLLARRSRAPSDRLIPKDLADQSASGARRLVEELQACFRNQRLSAVFQPVYDSHQGGIAFLEALTRLPLHGGAVSPEPYLGLLGSLGLGPALTEFILGQAVRVGLETGYSVSFNVNYHDLENRSLTARIVEQCLRFQDLPNQLIVELTESVPFRDPEVVRSFIAQVHGAGGVVFLDDFGTGYSNYASVVEARFDAIKICGSVVREAISSPGLRVLISGIANFCRTSGIAVVAEHISDPEILAMVREQDIRYLQGFLLQKPIPVARLLNEEFEFGVGAEDDFAVAVNSRNRPFGAPG